MERVGHRDLKFADLLRSAFSHRLGLLLESLALNPQASLENSHDLRFVLLGQRQQIRGMVGVRVRQKDHVESRNLFQRLRAHGVAHHKWVNQPNLATASRQRKRAVAEIGNLVSLGVDHQADLERRLEDVKRAGTRRALNYRAAAAPSFDANSERMAASYVARSPAPSRWPICRPSFA